MGLTRFLPSFLTISITLFAVVHGTTLKIKSMTGPVTILEIGEDGRENPRGNASPGRIIQDSQTIVTGSGSTAVLVYEDGTEITLKPDSKLTVGAQEESKGFLSLLSGSLLAKVKKLSSSDQFSVVTPTAIAGVRGTTFAVTVGDTGETHVGVEEGRVEVDDPDGDGKNPTPVSGGESSESVLGGPTRKEAGFKLASFSHDAWLKATRARMEERMPELMDGIEGRFKMTAMGMLKSQESFLDNMGKLKELSGKLKQAKAQGREIPESATSLHQALTQKIMMDVAKLKMAQQRMQALQPVLERLSVAGKINPKLASRMNDFAKRTADLRNQIGENRKAFAKDLDKHKDFMRDELKEARERAGNRSLSTPDGKGSPREGAGPGRGASPDGDRDRQTPPAGDRGRPGSGDRPDGPRSAPPPRR